MVRDSFPQHDPFWCPPNPFPASCIAIPYTHSNSVPWLRAYRMSSWSASPLSAQHLMKTSVLRWDRASLSISGWESEFGVGLLKSWLWMETTKGMSRARGVILFSAYVRRNWMSAWFLSLLCISSKKVVNPTEELWFFLMSYSVWDHRLTFWWYLLSKTVHRIWKAGTHILCIGSEGGRRDGEKRSVSFLQLSSSSLGFRKLWGIENSLCFH